MKSNISKEEFFYQRMEKRFMREKGLTIQQALWQTNQLAHLLHYIQTQKAYIVYQQSDNTLHWVVGTLVYYPITFNKCFNLLSIRGTVPYWDVRKRRWCTFKVENFLFWAPLNNPYCLEQSLLNQGFFLLKREKMKSVLLWQRDRLFLYTLLYMLFLFFS